MIHISVRASAHYVTIIWPVPRDFLLPIIHGHQNWTMLLCTKVILKKIKSQMAILMGQSRNCQAIDNNQNPILSDKYFMCLKPVIISSFLFLSHFFYLSFWFYNTSLYLLLLLFSLSLSHDFLYTTSLSLSLSSCISVGVFVV